MAPAAIKVGFPWTAGQNKFEVYAYGTGVHVLNNANDRFSGSYHCSDAFQKEAQNLL